MEDTFIIRVLPHGGGILLLLGCYLMVGILLLLGCYLTVGDTFIIRVLPHGGGYFYY